MFKLKIKNLDFEAGELNVVVLNAAFALDNDIHPMDRVVVSVNSRKKVVALVDVSEKIVKSDEIGIFGDIWRNIDIKDGGFATLMPIEKPESIKYIRKKMDKEELLDKEIYQIVKDIVDNKLTDVELAAFVSASYIIGLSLDETAALAKAVVDTGGKLNLKKKIIADKHCIGGVAGNRTTMLLVPIVSSLGITIPKTSSRSITSPAGTADTMEVLADVKFSIKELTSIVNKTNGCIVWGGAINLAAADDKLIKIRHPLSLDPEGLLLASIIAKKKAVGATHVIFDLPIGNEAKLQYLGEAKHLEREFGVLGKKFGMNVNCVITDGNTPIGRGIGPNLEAMDVLRVLRREKDAPRDLKSKSIFLTGKLLEMCGKACVGEGEKIAGRQIENGKAWTQMQRIIAAQGGNPKVKPSDIETGKYTLQYKAECSGNIYAISNRCISKIARTGGAPMTPSAGVFINKVLNERVHKGDLLFTVYSNSESKLSNVAEILKEERPVLIK